LSSLAFNQNIVVTVPGNTRFYIVIQKGAAAPYERQRTANTMQANRSQLPSADELRQLLQLRRELSEMYLQPPVQSTAQPVPESNPQQ
jgi:hypothetical protein